MHVYALLVSLSLIGGASPPRCPDGDCPLSGVTRSGVIVHGALPLPTVTLWESVSSPVPAGRFGLFGRRRSSPPQWSPVVPVPPTGVAPQLPPLPPGRTTPVGYEFLLKFRLGSYTCTAIAIGETYPDGTRDVITALHCWSHGAKDVRVIDAAGREYPIRLVKSVPAGDMAWCRTTVNAEKLPAGTLAEKTPPAGTVVWQAGNGTNKPGVVKVGTVSSQGAPLGQTAFVLSVSHGDSGGPIFDATTGEVVGIVSSTTVIGTRALMFGGRVETARENRPIAKAIGIPSMMRLFRPILVDDAVGSEK